ncbi:hypothetical protein CO151_08745 [bacterium CG_4_9_14_3_um_filter_65_15]|nr:MAG: hypothetical protein CO151_08745 [bacterium CG_4_9_14_3_um_filter_65_15]
MYRLRADDGGKKMKKFTMFACVALVLGMAMSSVAGDIPSFTSDVNAWQSGSNAYGAKAAGDTIQLMGPGGLYQGDFENAVCGVDRLPAGWSSVDLTSGNAASSHWHVFAPAGFDTLGITGNGLWCGDYFPACGANFAGYGDDWNDLVEWRYSVLDNSSSSTVTVSGNILYQVEQDYDYVYLSYQVTGLLGYQNALTFNGDSAGGVAEAFSGIITYLPGDYINGNEIVIDFRFFSDGAYSAEGYCYGGFGAATLDDVTVSVVNGANNYSTFDDFETGMGNWTTVAPIAVGDFAQIWCGLSDIDPCNTNGTNQVAFIDDGVVVPGTGGSQCVNWCYGPGGAIVTPTGGMSPGGAINNYVKSPEMTWPNATYDGLWFGFDVYRHEDFSPDSPGIFYFFGVRSALVGEDIETQGWNSTGYVYYGGPDYIRPINDATSWVQPARERVQIRMGCVQYFAGLDGYPAPYFDNVNLKVFPFAGPGVTYRVIDMAQDNFPEVGLIDMTDPSILSVRFDAANNTNVPSDLANDPADSITCTVKLVRTGAVLNGPPILHWTMQPNPAFNAYRTSIFGTATTGVSAGDSARNVNGIVAPNVWAFDLPDTGFLYPGDVLHYYIEASDDVAGDIKSVHIPGDISGYGDFSHPLAYNQDFIVHGLPSITGTPGNYTQPEVLFWNDFARRGGEQEWYSALDQLGYVPGSDYDIYYTTGPSSGVGNGLGGRASISQIANYNTMLYTSGDLSKFTISNGDFASSSDYGNDVDLVSSWLDLPAPGDPIKGMFLTGDELANDLDGSGTNTLTFLNDYMGLDLVSTNLLPLIDNQATPVVSALAGNGVIVNQSSWVAYGGCFGINTFDAVTPRAGATQLAEFLAPGCVAGQYTYSAATANVRANGSKLVSTPYDFMFIYDDPTCGAQAAAPLTARAQVLSDVLDWFGQTSGGTPSGVIPGAQFATKAFPNPFNPKVTVSYNMPKRGHVTVKIFNIRGELVRTLVDDVMDAGTQSVDWNGTSNSGSSVASGVYFYEARYGDEVQVNKITMVK